MKSFDITIIGGGMVGLALAASFADSSLRVAVIESSEPYQPIGEGETIRVSALHRASENYLKSLHAWPEKAYATPYVGMEVWEKDSFSQLNFNAEQLHQDNLGHIVENQALVLSLWQRVQQLSNVTVMANSRCHDLQIGENEAWLTVSTNHEQDLTQGEQFEHISSKLIVGADGANSWLRSQQNMPLTHWDYDHHAIVGHIRTQEPHQSIARQIFTPQGPIALLPLSEPNLCSLVWSTHPDRASQLVQMSESEFNKALTAEFDVRLGLCQLERARQSFALKMRYSRDFVQERVVLVGDAAHTIHPLAGQGVNLGLMDAASLAETVLDLAKQGKDIGYKIHLRDFERWRKTEAVKMITAMQGFKELFSGDNPVKKLLRSSGMSLVEKAPLFKTQMMKNALGVTGKLPMSAK